jgi:hypothetical protein
MLALEPRRVFAGFYGKFRTTTSRRLSELMNDRFFGPEVNKNTSILGRIH